MPLRKKPSQKTVYLTVPGHNDMRGIVKMAVGKLTYIAIKHAQQLATQWLWRYSNERPDTAIGGIPSRQLLNAV